jgi:hypothetical protein
MKRSTPTRRSEPVVPRWLGRTWVARSPENNAEAQRFLRFSKSKGANLLTLVTVLGIAAVCFAVFLSRHSGWPDGGDSAWLGAAVGLGIFVWSLVGFAGARLGRNRARTVEGYVLSILLGPLGWLITLCLPHRVVSVAVNPAPPLPPPQPVSMSSGTASVDGD